jgi:two-component system LytT family response regulator
VEKIKTVVVDDELSNIGVIVRFISELNSSFEIRGVAVNINSAYSQINEIKPDVVFLDIKMPGGSGFNLLEKFDKIDFEVVFISGFDSYAIKAFEFNALDYVLKPIDRDKFSKTLQKVQNKIEKKGIRSEDLQVILKSYDLNELVIAKIPIHVGNNVFLLSIEKIICIKSGEGCTTFSMITGDRYTSSKQLADFEFILENHPHLVRVNKSIYVNVNFISSYSKGLNCFLTMKDGTEIEISRRKKGEILELIKGFENRNNSSK